MAGTHGCLWEQRPASSIRVRRSLFFASGSQIRTCLASGRLLAVVPPRSAAHPWLVLSGEHCEQTAKPRVSWKTILRLSHHSGLPPME